MGQGIQNALKKSVDDELGASQHDFIDSSELMEAANVGLAVFSSDLTLLTANDRYYELCGYSRDEIRPGISLSDLIKFSLEKRNLDPTEIETTISTSLRRLKGTESHQFRFEVENGGYISITRRKAGQGKMFETVQELTGAEPIAHGSDQLGKLADLARMRLAFALEGMADGFALYDDQDRLVNYNKKYVELNPHIADMIMPGSRYEDMLREGVRRKGFDLHGMEPEAYIEWRLEQHLNPGEPYISQLTDGRWIRLNDHKTDDGGIVSVRADISDLKAHEVENKRISGDLSQASSRLDEALNNMVQGLCMFDADQKLILCNKQYLTMYGFSDEVVKPGIHMPDIMRYSISLGNYRDEDAQLALENRSKSRNLSERTTIKQYLKDGRVIAVLNEPMSSGGTIATYQDISTLEQHEARLVAYNKKLESSNRELQDFAYVASHDLQEPLRKIETFGDRLVRKHGELLPEDGQMYLDRMQNAAGRMRLLINDLLGYSRVTTKAKPFVEVNLQKVLDGVLSDIQMRLEETRGVVESSDLPIIPADNTQMRQLLQNLISNALKFCRPDVAPIVKISAEKAVIHTENGIPRDIWRLCVADNGIGFDNQYKNQIFAIFQRLHGRLEYEGTGIGLATCRKIVERHHGTIDANGVPGEGATFTIELPAEQEQSEE
ncbi:MAG: PAS domain-containing protein [Rhizobiaceae bacterium]|nr:PAS domain-containing protein [Rhizobiaceae bacterium]